MMGTPDAKVNADIPELIDDLVALADKPADYRSSDFPFILSAGERRAFTANTIMRDSTWRKKDPDGALRLSPADAASLGVESGDKIRITTKGGSAVAPVESTTRCRTATFRSRMAWGSMPKPTVTAKLSVSHRTS